MTTTASNGRHDRALPEPVGVDDGGAGSCSPRVTASAMGAEAAGHLGAVLRALADPLRLRMLSMITASPDGEACVCDLTELTDVTQPTVSHHLKVLKDAGVLVSERRGTWVHYRVAPGARPAVTALLDSFAPATTARPAPSWAEDRSQQLDTDAVLDGTVARLTPRFGDLPAELVARVVRESYTDLVRTARIGGHLPVLAERFAAERLEDVRHARTAGDATTDPAAQVARRPQVLFVCVANAGRSQLAAALLTRYAGDAVVVRSAGSSPGEQVHPQVEPLLAEILGRTGAAEAFPKPLTDDALRAADVVVTMGCGDTCPVLPGTRYEDWPVGDPALASAQGARAIRDEIDRRVQELAADLLSEPSPRPSQTLPTAQPHRGDER